MSPECCDMGANNIKSLKLLGATRWKPFFKFQNQDTLTMYVPPHLLNCTSNLFLKYDVQFESELMHNQLPVLLSGNIFYMYTNGTNRISSALSTSSQMPISPLPHRMQ